MIDDLDTILAGVPGLAGRVDRERVFASWVDEPAFSYEGVLEATVCLWRQSDDDRWHGGAVELPAGDDPDGADRLFAVLVDPTLAVRDDGTVLISATEPLLRSMLDDAGVRPGAVSGADMPTTVEVFRRFAAVPVDDAAPPEDDGDGVLAQFGAFTVDGVREFSANLTRQFIEACDGDAMWQLSCTLHWAPDAETDALGSGQLWSFGMPLDDFFAEVSALSGWAWALAGVRAPRELTLQCEQI